MWIQNVFNPWISLLILAVIFYFKMQTVNIGLNNSWSFEQQKCYFLTAWVPIWHQHILIKIKLDTKNWLTLMINELSHIQRRFCVEYLLCLVIKDFCFNSPHRKTALTEIKHNGTAFLNFPITRVQGQTQIFVEIDAALVFDSRPVWWRLNYHIFLLVFH